MRIRALRIFALSIFAAATAFVAAVSQASVKEGQSISSEILGYPVEYAVYLPPDYDTSSRSYPVVYLLHGYGDDETGWIQFGEIDRLADAAIASGEIPPMVIIMPDGKKNWYINNHDSSVRYEDFFLEEFIPAVESVYRIRSEKRFRGVSGLSMGGYGSLVYALRRPDLFAACSALSSGLRTTAEHAQAENERYDRVFTPVFGPDRGGEKRITEHFLRNNPIHLVETGDVDDIKSVRFYIDCGDEDFLFEGNSALHVAMRKRGVPHEYRVRDGGHQWSYWRSGVIPGLKFIGESFHQP